MAQRLVRLIAIDSVDPILLPADWCANREHAWFNQYAAAAGDTYTGVWRDCLIAMIQHYRGELDLHSLEKDVRRRMAHIDGFEFDDSEIERELAREAKRKAAADAKAKSELAQKVLDNMKKMQPSGCFVLPGKRRHMKEQRSAFRRWLAEQGEAQLFDLLEMSKDELAQLAEAHLEAVCEWFQDRV